MNLIEQLGGYSIARTEYKMPIKLLNIDYEQLATELLEHRRQHNIFEMDDYIIHDGELKVFAMWSTAIDGCAYIGYAYSEDGEMADKDEFRHATDAEIEAGHRL